MSPAPGPMFPARPTPTLTLALALAVGLGLLPLAAPRTARAAEAFARTVDPVRLSNIDPRVSIDTLKVDADGSLYVAGHSLGRARFGANLTVGVDDRNQVNLWVARQDPTGAWNWVTIVQQYNDKPQVAIRDLALSDTHVAVVGERKQAGSSPLAGFVARLAKTGTGASVISVGGTNNATQYAAPSAVDFDASGNVYVAGRYKGHARIGTLGIDGIPPIGTLFYDQDIFVCRLTPTLGPTWIARAGSSLQDIVGFAGTRQPEDVVGLEVDAAGTVYVGFNGTGYRGLLGALTVDRPIMLQNAGSLSTAYNLYTGIVLANLYNGALMGVVATLSPNGVWNRANALNSAAFYDRPWQDDFILTHDVPLTHLTLADGKLFVAGRYTSLVSAQGVQSFATRLGADTLQPDGPTLYLKNLAGTPTVVRRLTAAGGRVFFTGSMGASLKAYQLSAAETELGTVDREITSVGSNEFLLGTDADLNPLWARTTTRPNDQLRPTTFVAADVAYDSLRRILYWGGTFQDPTRKLWLGEENNPITLGPASDSTGWLTALTDDGAYREQVRLQVESSYGPITINGVTFDAPAASIVLLRDTEVTVSVPSLVSPAPANSGTRHRCTGFRINGNILSGDASSFSLRLTEDLNVSFSWLTEHLLKVLSDHADAGLGVHSAAGLADPPLGDSWIPHGQLVNAFIDGLVTPVDGTEVGTRYVVTGYDATGSAAPSVTFDRIEARQQVRQFTMTNPSSLAFRWKRQHRVQVSTSSDDTFTLPLVRALDSQAKELRRTEGAGESWFDHGSPLHLAARAQEPTLGRALRGWRNADPVPQVFPSIEFIAPQDAIDDALQLQQQLTLETIDGESYWVRPVAALLRPIRVTWDYGDLVFRINTTIGNPIDLSQSLPVLPGSPPRSVRIVDAPPGSSVDDMQVWDQVAQLAYPLRPGITFVDWDTPTGGRLVTQIFAGFPGDPIPELDPPATFPGTPHYRHVADTPPEETPAVLLDPDPEDARFFHTIKFRTGDATAVEGRFSASEPGRTVLLFSTSTDPKRAAVGDLTREPLSVRVAETRRWDDARAWSGSGPLLLVSGSSAVIGSPLASSLDTAGLGTGYLIHPVANYNASLYDRSIPEGPIIPVNRPLATPPAGNRLVVVWYESRDGIRWPYQPVAFDSFSWPTPPVGGSQNPNALRRIVIASRLGSDGLDAAGQPQPEFDPLRFADLQVYSQSDTNLPGYNPNEEHARIYPSFLHAARSPAPPAVFALRDDLNLSQALIDFSPTDALGTNQYTSDPYVLVQFRDLESGQPGMAVYQVQRDDPLTRDPRLLDLPGTATTAYSFQYRMTAGEPVSAPYPLNLVLGLQPCVNTVPFPLASPSFRPNGSYFVDGNLSQRTWMVDHKGQAWAVSGNSYFLAHYQYPLAPDFWYPFPSDADPDVTAVGDCIAFLPPFDLDRSLRGVFSPNTDERWLPTPVRFDTAWPDAPPVLKVGESLTYAGGEYKADHPTAKGLPGVIGWAAGEVVFDSFNPAMATRGQTSHFHRFSARLISPLEERRVSLPTSRLPAALQAGSPEIRVEGDRWFFASLPPSLQKRVFFQPLSKLRAVDAPGVLGLRGFVNDRTLGASDLTAAPPPVYVLEPNVLTPDEHQRLLDLAPAHSDWRAAVDALFLLARNPSLLDENNDRAPDTSWLVGLEPEPTRADDGSHTGTTPQGAVPARALGPGLALVPSPALLDPANLAPSAYLTLAENNHPSLGAAPVTLHVIRIDRQEIYRGAIKTIAPPNVFDEKITLRHSADFGGNLDQVAFSWWYHEEDGSIRTGDVPPGSAPGPVWNSLGNSQGSLGQFQLELDGNPTLLLADNLFFVRYRHASAVPTHPDSWSDWAGAANSSIRDLDADGRPDFRAQLASGWVKRVLDAVNPFEARLRDFARNDSPSTTASMIQQLGAPYAGPVALNSDPNVIQNVGLIELYETVLRRARSLSIDASNPTATPGVQAAILLASTRLADFYALLAREAATDAGDPTLGLANPSLDPASLGSSRFCFENQLPSLLDEELALLRGRDESLGRPVHNRLFWNFTKGEGEVAYALNYGITDVTGDGFVDEHDASRLHPHGHGDAWGHYLSSLRKHYDLLLHPLYRWNARSEFYNLLDVVLDVDFSDERNFARTAAERARVGADLVALTYRGRYLENVDAQWQGYLDPNPTRSWGVSEWARRAGQAALFDWITANTLVPFEDSDPTHTGIRKIDRKNLGDIGRISAHLGGIQILLDSSNSGLNPLGLDPNVVPFDIDPTHLDVGSTAQIGRQAVQGLTHFEQIFERAFAATKNAREALDYANAQKTRLAQLQLSADQRRLDAAALDLEFRNRLVEIFGTPYEGTVGPGKPYPAGYQGPDLNLFMYVDVNAVNDTTVPTAAPEYYEAFIDFHELTADLPDTFAPSATNYFLRYDHESELEAADNMTAEFVDGSIVRLTLPATAADYTFVAPADWGQRAAPGRLQLLAGEMVQTQARLALAVGDYDFLHKQIRDRIETLEVRANLKDAELTLRTKNFKKIVSTKTILQALEIARITAEQFASETLRVFDNAAEALPKVVGTANDVTSAPRFVIKTAGNVASTISSILAVAQTAAAAGHELTLYSLEELGGLTIDKQDFDAEVVGLLSEIEELLVGEGTSRIAIFEVQEQLRSQLDQYRATLQEGIRLLEERRQANARLAAATQNDRYHDAFLRDARNEATQRYRATFDLAARYAYLAAKAYDYETNFDLDDRASAIPLLTEIVRERSLGELGDNQPLHAGGLAGILARLQDNFRAIEGRLGFNNLQLDTTSFSLKHEELRVSDNSDWRSRLRQARVSDLNTLPEFRRFCRPFSAAPTPQPGIVLRFDTRIQAGFNFFNKPLGAGDSSYDPTLYATKIRAAGVRFDNYPVSALARTPYVYLVPAGIDTLIIPDSPVLKTRSWNVVDQAIPAPFAIGSADLGRPNWIASLDTLSGPMSAIRKFSSFRAGVSPGDPDLNVTRFIGRSVWNSNWILIIPGLALHSNPDTGLETLIREISDIRLSFETYGYSGN